MYTCMYICIYSLYVYMYPVARRARPRPNPALSGGWPCRDRGRAMPGGQSYAQST